VNTSTSKTEVTSVSREMLLLARSLGAAGAARAARGRAGGGLRPLIIMHVYTRSREILGTNYA